jgi:hypothetical protein
VSLCVFSVRRFISRKHAKTVSSKSFFADTSAFSFCTRKVNGIAAKIYWWQFCGGDGIGSYVTKPVPCSYRNVAGPMQPFSPLNRLALCR